MDKIRTAIQTYVKNPIVTAITGLVIGLIIGLPVLGWLVFPVKWKDADASFLRQDLKAQYLCMIVDSYKVNKNASLAAARLDSMGVNLLESPSTFNSLQAGGCNYAPTDETVLSLKSALLAVPGTPVATSNLPAATPTVGTKSTGGLSGVLLGLLCVLFLAIGGVLIYIFLFRNRRNREQVPPATEDVNDYETPVEEEGLTTPTYSTTPKSSAPGNDAPAAHFMTTFAIGDDLYDDSFSIDAANGEFLGECGVGISDTVGVGEPKKVSAFEVWLFDKNDIQTVTKVLMSSKAINDLATRQRLASKGEPVEVQPGLQVLLETASLQLQARVIEMVYGQGARPSGSYFESLTLELTVWPK
jgi:hypothetical protein